MHPLVTLYFSIAMAIWAVFAVVAVHTAIADVAAGVIVLATLAMVARAILQLLTGDGPTAGATRS